MVLHVTDLAAGPDFRINRPGQYRLTGRARSIEITTSFVKLDLNGKTVNCSGGEIGIDAIARRWITVVNGRVTNCRAGINAPYASRGTFRDLRGNHHIGINLSFGSGHTVAGDTFGDMSGWPGEAYAVGINGAGSGSTIERNTFDGIEPVSSEGVGILVSDGERDVTITNNRLRVNNPGDHIAIWIAERATVTTSHNTIEGYRRKVLNMGTVTDAR